MRKVLAFGVLLTVIVLVTNDTYAQRPPFGGGGRGGMLIANKGVQEELKITDEQKEKIAEKMKGMAEKQKDIFSKLKDVPKDEIREKMAAMFKESQTAMNKELAEVLKPEQIKRLKQIERQQDILVTLTTDDEVKKELKITDDQLSKFKGLGEDLAKENSELRKGFKDNPKDTQEKMTALRKEFSDKAVAALTSEQKKTWKELTGEPFEVKFDFGTRKKKTDN